MPNNKVDYLKSFCLPNGQEQPKDLLVLAAYQFRIEQDLRFTKNIASVMFVYAKTTGEREKFGPFAYGSDGQGKEKSRHSERLALANIIREAIKQGFGSFKGAGLQEADIPSPFSIEDIDKNKKLGQALELLQGFQLYLFTERIPCYDNDGCEHYLLEVSRKMLGQPINVYYSIGKNPDIVAQTQIQLTIQAIQQEEMIEQKNELREQIQEKESSGEKGETVEALHAKEKEISKHLLEAFTAKSKEIEKQIVAIRAQYFPPQQSTTGIGVTNPVASTTKPVALKTQPSSSSTTSTATSQLLVEDAWWLKNEAALTNAESVTNKAFAESEVVVLEQPDKSDEIATLMRANSGAFENELLPEDSTEEPQQENRGRKRKLSSSPEQEKQDISVASTYTSVSPTVSSTDPSPTKKKTAIIGTDDKPTSISVVTSVFSDYAAEARNGSEIPQRGTEQHESSSVNQKNQKQTTLLELCTLKASGTSSLSSLPAKQTAQTPQQIVQSQTSEQQPTP